MGIRPREREPRSTLPCSCVARVPYHGAWPGSTHQPQLYSPPLRSSSPQKTSAAGSGDGDAWSSDGSSGSDSDSYSDSDSDSSGSDSDSEEAFEAAALRKKKKAAPKKRKAKAPKKRKQAPKPQDAGPESWAVSQAWRQMSFAERSPPIAESDGSAAQAAPIEDDEEDEDEPQVR